MPWSCVIRPMPAAFVFRRDQIETFRDLVGDALQVRIHRAGHEGPGDGGLFEDVARVMRRKGVQNALELARLFDHARQVLPGDLFAIALPQQRAVDALVDQVASPSRPGP